MRSFRESSPTSGTFPLSLAFCPFIPRLLSGKFHDKLVFLTPTFFGLYQLNIECRLLFYQLLIPDKGERAGVILPLWVWELGFPKKKKNGNLEPTRRSRQISKYCLSPSAFVVLRKCSQSKRHLCITTSSPAPHAIFTRLTITATSRPFSESGLTQR